MIFLTFCFNYLILIVYYFAYIDTYFEDYPPQQGEEMDEDVEQPIGHRPIMPQRLDFKFQTKLVDHICDVFVTEGEQLAYVREIM